MLCFRKVSASALCLMLVLSGCGGGGDEGTSSAASSGVNTSDAGSTSATSSVDFNVSQVLSNWYGSQASYTLSGKVSEQQPDGSMATNDVQLILRVMPLSVGLWNGQVLGRAEVSKAQWVNGVADTAVSRKETDYFSSGPFRFQGREWADVVLVDELVVNPVAVPTAARVGASGSLGRSQFYQNFNTAQPTLLSEAKAYSYSVEAASSVDTAWVCLSTESRDDQSKLEHTEKLCLLTNANSSILGASLRLRSFNSVGRVVVSGFLRQ